MLEKTLQSLAEPSRRWLGEKIQTCALTAISIGLGAVGAAFGTCAAFAALQDEFGRVEAALVVGAFYFFLALVWPAWRLLRRTSGSQAVAVPPDGTNLDSALKAICGSGAIDDPAALAAITQIARSLSPFQILSIAVVGGFIAGRKLHR